MSVVYDDGGRAAAGYVGDANDCVIRSIAIATGRDYRLVLSEIVAAGGKNIFSKGVSKKIRKKYLEQLGWKWVPAMSIGMGCKVHLRSDELPPGKIIVSTSKHLVAVIDGIIHDTHDPSRDGTRCVYGHFKKGVT